MKQLLKQYAGGLILLALLTALIGACLWSSRPVRLNASELTPAETLDSLPGLELYLDTHRGHTLSMTVVNRSGLSVESGGSVDQDAALYLEPGLDVLLNGAWYNVPYEPYTSAGSWTRSRRSRDRSASPNSGDFRTASTGSPLGTGRRPPKMSAPGRISPSMPRTPGWRSWTGTIPFPPHPHKTQKTTPYGVVLKFGAASLTARWQRPPYTRRSGPPNPQRPSTQIPSHSPPSFRLSVYPFFPVQTSSLP